MILAIALILTIGGNVMGSKKAPKENYVGYLFAYFTGNRVPEEAVRFAISPDGYNYLALNKNNPVIDSKDISATGGVRDPHVLRCEDGKTFYMVVTDMTSSKGWSSNRAFSMLKSNDLITWTASVINIQQKYPNQEDLKRVWAPQTVYDKKAKRYMVYWSMKYGEKQDVIYYAYANKDFTDIEGEPKPLFIPANGMCCIDADIVLKGDTYYMFYKTEDAKKSGIKLATTKKLSSGKWKEHEGFKEDTPDKVEGSSVYKLINSDTYVMMYDLFTTHNYEFAESKDLEHFKSLAGKTSVNFHARHGSVIPITQDELNRLTEKWGTPPGYAKTGHNPVINGFYADPEILYSHKTGKYYIYPTSDGFENWGGYYFKVFSSDDLSNWKDEGVMLDLKKDVLWAKENAWAPCIIEKKVGDEYKYYYYFTAGKKIGVAVADNPTGPFKDSGKALIDFKPEGIKRGQEIDPDVFFDSASGKYYLYWGNGYLAAAELNDDMVSIKKETMRVITPNGTFREGAYVFERNGIYYFTWSENDTRNEDYRVRYGTSASPMGPISIPQSNMVIKKVSEKGIYGTGHHSVLQKPGTDEWYIVYHRFTRPDGIKMGRSAGYNRETCIDRMEFNADGSIKEVVPTE